MCWFFGFKVHFLVNHNDEIINFCITPGNVSDCNEQTIDQLTRNIFRKLLSKNIQLITKIRKNIKNILMEIEDKILLKKRGTIEPVINILKKFFSIDNTRHRNTLNFLNNLCSGLIAYVFKPEKPSICSNKVLLSD